MQTITVLALGKLNASYFKSAADAYAKRLRVFCRLQLIELPEESLSEKTASPAMIEKVLEKEGKAILAAVPKGSTRVALCIEGQQFTSEKLAALFAEKADSGAGDVTFILGSSHGLSQQVKAASLQFSMSKMTFPHQLARVMLMEQIYRACSINAGTKYHK